MRGEQIRSFEVRDYDLAETLTSGQAFRWAPANDAWIGVIGRHWVRLHASASRISAETAAPVTDWDWLVRYLQIDVELDPILRTFPTDEPMRRAVTCCRGLRLLRQDPWECLVSFILSSSKQIVQIQQNIALLCARFGDPVPAPPQSPPAFAFPAPERLAASTEAELRLCKMGYRAPYLLNTARIIAQGQVDLNAPGQLPLEAARTILLELPGVGRKVADCVLLFAYGFDMAFPVDVWVMKGLRQLYFPKRRVNLKRLHTFAATHFGPHAGYAQQYLFHYMRKRGRVKGPLPPATSRRDCPI